MNRYKEMDLPEGVTPDDVERYLRYIDWETLNSKVISRSATEAEVGKWQRTQLVAGRPDWMSLMTSSQMEGFEQARRFLTRQENKS